MKRRRLPPLNPLRSFEAAGRHCSFTKAAEELNVTTVAVSRQIAVLEGYFGVTLFERMHQIVRLTSAGMKYLPRVSAALDLIDEGSQELRSAAPDPITVCAYPSFAMQWLIPRLGRFRALHPNVEISITTAVKPAEFDFNTIDIGIQFMGETKPGLQIRRILPDVIHPVCHPELANGMYPLPPVANLRHHSLLHSRYRRLDWQEWLEATGHTDIKPSSELTLKGSGLAYQAAAEGLGVAMAQRLLVFNEIVTNRLVAPFPHAVQRPGAICLATLERACDDSRIASFIDWIEAEAAESMKSIGVPRIIPDSGTVECIEVDS